VGPGFRRNSGRPPLCPGFSNAGDELAGCGKPPAAPKFVIPAAARRLRCRQNNCLLIALFVLFWQWPFAPIGVVRLVVAAVL
jgi:hypothetical protein